MPVGLTPTRLLVLGAVFHFVYVASIFDIYFRSPLVHGMKPVEPPRPAPASRLVLIVADGLRADKLYANRLELAPYLRTIVEEQGSWGVSHTRVPTESRPGHVALIAGFYEDVSAVTKGWKANPVEFDSVFNRSTHTWSFGSPDILPMFAHGTSEKDKVDMFMYSTEHEDFSKDGSWLDTWVFDKVEELFYNASKDVRLDKALRQDQVVFFLHLLGLDTNGHAFRPHSDTYLANIKLVDSRIPGLVNLFDSFYGDGNTAYVFTADHGMNSRGAHGDGDKENTETPLVCWGSGVAGPYKNPTRQKTADELRWNLSDLDRHDVEQGDIAPLMSTLLGLPPPMNAVGKLPLPYLDPSLGEGFRAAAALANARQAFAQYSVKEAAKRRTEPWFKPFPGFDLHGDDMLDKAAALIDRGAFVESETLSMKIVELSTEGNRYYQTYDWLFLRTVVSIGYLGWIVFGISWTIEAYSDVATTKKSSASWASAMNALAVASACLFAIFLFYKESPWMYYVYTFFPILFWCESLKRLPNLWCSVLVNWTPRSWIMSIGSTALYVAGMELLTSCYFDRRILAFVFFSLAVGYPAILPKQSRSRGMVLIVSWLAACIAAGVFTLFPVDLPENLTLINLGAGLIAAGGTVAVWNRKQMLVPPELCGGVSHTKQSQEMKRSLIVQTVLVLVAGALVNLTSKAFEKRAGLPLINQVATWLLAFGSMAVPFMGFPESVAATGHDVHYLFRLISIFLAFAPCYVLLTVSYEALFYGTFCWALFSWLLLEQRAHEANAQTRDAAGVTMDIGSAGPGLVDLMGSARRRTRLGTNDAQEPGTTGDEANDKALNGQLNQKGKLGSHRPLRFNDLRTSLVFLSFLIAAFFGTGNMASVSSFSMESVRRFQAVFDPFVMGALLIFRILVPYFALSAVFGILSQAIDLPPHALFFLTISTTDLMTLRFFFLVRDSGSWLEIGTSISHFVISSGLLVFNMILFGISSVLVNRIIVLGLPRPLKAKE